MTTVVLDTNTVVSAIFWPRSAARRCLAGLARRWYAVAASVEVFAEYDAVAAELQPRFPACNRAGALGWLRLIRHVICADGTRKTGLAVARFTSHTVNSFRWNRRRHHQVVGGSCCFASHRSPSPRPRGRVRIVMF